ncbi:MAG TPA: exodeoxyribonuclease III [Kofleriaceae bacterium]|nr:exodeoxyribonuclease III [Kofleriaceae bacterium]
MRIVTWNVNSIRMRETRVKEWVERVRPDILCMQEVKVDNASFPTLTFTALGYKVAVHGQRTYNGVAIAARHDITDITTGFGDGGDDDHSRFIMATVAGVRVGSVYVPNGQAPGTDKYAYKLEWLARLRRWLDASADPASPLALCGDWNVAPGDLDVHDPKRWAGQILCSEPEREAWRQIVAWGTTDVYRAAHPTGTAFSWWDYRGVSFFKDQGLRIDHILATAPLAARLQTCTIDREQRKGRDASDHAPVTADFTD